MKQIAPWRRLLPAIGLAAGLLMAGCTFSSVFASASQVALSTSTSLPREWNHWRYFQWLPQPSASQPAFVAVRIPQSVYAHSSPNLADLRVINESGQAVPYAAFSVRTVTHTETLAVHDLQRSRIAGNEIQLQVDLGKEARPYNALRIQTSASDFIGWAELAVSADGRNWQPLASRAPLFRFEQRNIHGKSVISFPESHSRYLRLKIVESGKGFPVEGLTVFHTTLMAGDRVAVTGSFHSVRSSSRKAKAWQVRLPADLPVNELDFEAPARQFSARVTIDSSNDGETWSRCGAGQIYRIRDGDERQESLRVEFAETTATYWRVEASDGKGSLDSAQLTLYMTPRRVVFQQKPGRRYRLIYGESEAKPPEYDLAATVSGNALQDAPVITELGPEIRNSGWVDPRPWTERHPPVLWFGLGLSALILGYAVRRAYLGKQFA